MKSIRSGSQVTAIIGWALCVRVIRFSNPTNRILITIIGTITSIVVICKEGFKIDVSTRQRPASHRKDVQVIFSSSDSRISQSMANYRLAQCFVSYDCTQQIVDSPKGTIICPFGTQIVLCQKNGKTMKLTLLNILNRML